MIKLNDILNEDYPYDVFKKIEKLKGGALLRFGNEIWIRIGNRNNQWICGKGPEKGVVSDSTVVAQRIVKSGKTLKIESKLNEKLNKSDLSYQVKNDYSGNTPPKITKLNSKEVSIWYGYKVNPKDVIKSFKQIHPHITMKHIKWSNISTGGGVHTFKITEGKLDEMQMVNKKTGEDITKHVIAYLEKKISKKEFEKLTGLKKDKLKVNEGKKEDAAVEKAIIAMVDSMIKAGKRPGEITKHLKSQVPYKITTNAIRKLINRQEIKPGEWLNEQRPIPTDTPNEFVYSDFKKWAYKKRGKIKKQMASLSASNRERALVAVWELWDKKNKGAYSNIKDYKKFGKALWNMMEKDRLV